MECENETSGQWPVEHLHCGTQTCITPPARGLAANKVTTSYHSSSCLNLLRQHGHRKLPLLLDHVAVLGDVGAVRFNHGLLLLALFQQLLAHLNQLELLGDKRPVVRHSSVTICSPSVRRCAGKVGVHCRAFGVESGKLLVRLGTLLVPGGHLTHRLVRAVTVTSAGISFAIG